MNTQPLRYPLPPGTKIVEALKPRRPQPCVDLHELAEKRRREKERLARPVEQEPTRAPEPPQAPVSPPPVVDDPPAAQLPPEVLESEVPPPALDLSEFPGAADAALTPAAARARRKAQS